MAKTIVNTTHKEWRGTAGNVKSNSAYDDASPGAFRFTLLYDKSVIERKKKKKKKNTKWRPKPQSHTLSVGSTARACAG